MLDPTTSSGNAAATSKSHLDPQEVSLTEDYGDEASNSRTLGGGVDFFSGLGTEHKRKPNARDKLLSEQVCPIILF